MNNCIKECDLRYNFPSIPNKFICAKCFKKGKLDLKNLDWNLVNEFQGEKRTDEELVNHWVR